VERLLDHSSLAKPLLCTFHSLCVRFCAATSRPSKWEPRADPLLCHLRRKRPAGNRQAIMKRMGLTPSSSPRAPCGKIPGQEPHGRSAEYYLASKDPTASASPTFQGLPDRTAQEHALDFDDCCLKPSLAEGFRRGERALPRRYKYLLVTSTRTPTAAVRADEAAGRRGQERLRRGRRDQSIYSWRAPIFATFWSLKRISRRSHRPARAELPLDPGDTGGGRAVVANNLPARAEAVTDRQGARSSATTRLRTAKTRLVHRRSHPEVSREPTRRRESRGATIAPCSIAPTPVASGRRGSAPLQHPLHMVEVSAFTNGPRSRTCSLPQAGPQSARFDGLQR